MKQKMFYNIFSPLPPPPRPYRFIFFDEKIVCLVDQGVSPPLSGPTPKKMCVFPNLTCIWKQFVSRAPVASCIMH